MKKAIALLLAAFLLTTPALASAGPDSRSVDPAVCAHHFEVSVVKQATCSQKGLLAYTCAKCGLTYTAETLPDEDAHEYALTDSTAGCTEDGENVYTCALCGASYTEPAPATGHVPSAEAAGCVEPVVCTVCGEVLTPASGHDYQYQYDARFDEDGALVGFGTWKCANCGDVMAATEGNAREYYGLTEAPSPEGAPEAPDSSGTDIVLAEGQTYEDDSPTDGQPADDADGTQPTDEPQVDRRTGLWITISAVVLAVVIVEAVVLTSSLKKDKTTL